MYIGVRGMVAPITDEARRWGRELRKGSTRLVLLTALVKGETYGYELLQRLRNSSSPTGASEATLYPLLRDLETNGHLESRWEHNGTGPGRKYYRLSKSGFKLLSLLRNEWSQFQDEIKQVLNNGRTNP